MKQILLFLLVCCGFWAHGQGTNADAQARSVAAQALTQAQSGQATAIQALTNVSPIIQSIGTSPSVSANTISGTGNNFPAIPASRDSKIASISAQINVAGAATVVVMSAYEAPSSTGGKGMLLTIISETAVILPATGLVTLLDGIDFSNILVPAGGYVCLRPGVGKFAFKSYVSVPYYNLTGSGVGTVMSAFSPLTGAEMLYQIQLTPVPVAVRYDTYDQVSVSARVSGSFIDLSGTEVIRQGTKTVLSSLISIPSATTGIVGTLTAKVLSTGNAKAGLITTSGAERARNVTGVVVKRTSDQVVLTSPTDYTIDAANGYVTATNSGVSSITVDVSFSYYRSRVDVIQLNLDGTVSRIAGTERSIEYNEDTYRAVPTNGGIVLAYVFIRGNSISVLSAGQFEGKFKRGQEGELVRAIQFGKDNLSKTLKKLRAGTAITMAGYGDSITGMGGSYSGSYTRNNGVTDRPDLFFLYYSADALAAIPRFTSVQLGHADDGLGAVHAKIGWNWTLKAFLEKKYSSAITYNNYGLPGSFSGNTVDNGTYPQRIAQLVSDAPDFCVIAFGMNEVGNAASYANVVSIITQLQAVSTECIVMGVPRPTQNHSTLANWRYTNNQLKQAAIYTNSAYVPTEYASDNSQLEYLGNDLGGVCSGNFYNHPSQRELRLYGEMLTLFFGLSWWQAVLFINVLAGMFVRAKKAIS